MKSRYTFPWRRVQPEKRDWNRWEILFVTTVFLAGLALRLHRAAITYLNPDEIQVALIALRNLRQMLHASLEITHPPLLVMVTYVVSRISRSDLALRFIPVVAGSLFPLLLFFWLRRVAGSIAGMVALFLLTLTPQTIILSAQLRPYTLALAFVSASLLALEIALENDRWQTMAVYNLLLWLSIVSDYSAAWFAGAAGVYALLRLKGRSHAVKICWAAGQAAALMLYAFLFVIQVGRYRGSFIEQDAVNNWLRDSFPQPGEMLAFPFTHTPRIFHFLVAPAPLGGLSLLLFASAFILLWTRRTHIASGNARAVALLFSLPFLIAIAAAYAREFPYGGTRHTIMLDLFAAIGIGIAVGTLPKIVAWPMLCAMLLLSPVWSQTKYQGDIADDRNQTQQILDCLAYMRATIPPGELIFTELETVTILSYYAGETDPPWSLYTGKFSDHPLCGRWRVATRDLFYWKPEEFAAALADFRRQYGLGEHARVWVLDGGWSVVAGPPDEKLPFTRAVRVTQIGD